MKRNNTLKFLHIINIIITIMLLLLSISSTFFIDKAVIPTGEDLEIGFLFRVIISTSIILFSFISLLTGVIFPSNPYFLNKHQKNNINKVANIGIGMVSLNTLSKLADKKGDFGTLIESGAKTSVLLNAKNIKYVQRVWIWHFGFTIFIFTSAFTWFLFLIESNIEGLNLLRPFIYSATISTYNILISICLLLLMLFTITSMIWRILMDKIYKDNKYWIKEPIIYVIISFIWLILMVKLIMYFQLNYLGMIILILTTMYILNLVDKKFLKTSYFTFGNSSENKENKIVDDFFCEEASTNDIKYYYHFGKSDEKEKRLESFEQLKRQFEELKILVNNKDNQKDVELCVIAKPNINGIDRIFTICQYNKKKKMSEFLIEIFKTKTDDEEIIYLYYPTSINEIMNIYYEFIKNKNLPDFSEWQKINNLE